MADPELVARLRRSLAEWNQWRANIPFSSRPDLGQANLRGADLRRADLRETDLEFADLTRADLGAAKLAGANLKYAHIYRTNLREADLTGANLRQADLMDAELSGADLERVDLTEANLTRADLTQADLESTDFRGADLTGANLTKANLRGAELSHANVTRARLHHASLMHTVLDRTDLTGADFWGATLWGTIFTRAKLTGTNLRDCTAQNSIFSALDLSVAEGLETVKHRGPSTIGIDTLYLSDGKIPEEFLRGAGVPETFIAYARSLVGQAIEFYSVFISHSTADQAFADRLYADLRNQRIRCWLATEDLRIRDRIRDEIQRSIRVHDKLLLVLSEAAIRSNWVETEVETALERERQQARDLPADARRPTVLFPIRLDDAVMQSPMAWAGDVRRTRRIGDFRRWKDHDAYVQAFDRLLRDLKPDTVAGASS
jgi:uncharacterized protein YjbI with pentapeptide repeats